MFKPYVFLPLLSLLHLNTTLVDVQVKDSASPETKASNLNTTLVDVQVHFPPLNQMLS